MLYPPPPRPPEAAVTYGRPSRPVINRMNRQQWGLKTWGPMICKGQKCPYAKQCWALEAGVSHVGHDCVLDYEAYEQAMHVALNGRQDLRPYLEWEHLRLCHRYALACMGMERLGRYRALHPHEGMMRKVYAEGPAGPVLADVRLSYGRACAETLDSKRVVALLKLGRARYEMVEKAEANRREANVHEANRHEANRREAECEEERQAEGDETNRREVNVHEVNVEATAEGTLNATEGDGAGGRLAEDIQAIIGDGHGGF